MKIPKIMIKPIMVISMSVGILSSSVPLVSYAAEPEREVTIQETEEKNPVTENVVYDVYGEVGGGKVSMNENELHEICKRVASEYDNLDAYILHALCIQETRARDNVNDVYTSASALGITQIEPSVHEKDIEDLGYTNDDVRNDPEAGVAVAAKILSERIDARDGNIYKALIDYNMGQTKANEKFANNPNYRWEYADNVLNVADKLESELEYNGYEDVELC